MPAPSTHTPSSSKPLRFWLISPVRSWWVEVVRAKRKPHFKKMEAKHPRKGKRPFLLRGEVLQGGEVVKVLKRTTLRAMLPYQFCLSARLPIFLEVTPLMLEQVKELPGAIDKLEKFD